MAKIRSNRITSCTISWKNDRSGAITKVLQTEIQVRVYHSGNLISGRIWPMSEKQKQDLYSILNQCLEDWDRDDYTVDEADGDSWQFKICTQGSCLRTICGTSESPPHGMEIKKLLAGIIGEENCFFF